MVPERDAKGRTQQGVEMRPGQDGFDGVDR